MKLRIIVITSILFLSFLLIHSLSVINQKVFADFEGLYQEYLKIQQKYQSAYSRYISTKNQYFTYGTLSAKNEAIKALQEFLVARSDVLLAYIELLRERNSEETYHKLLNDEEQFINSHIDKARVIGSLEDGVRESKTLEARHVPFQITSRKITGTIIVNRLIEIKNEIDILEQDTQKLLQKLQSQDKDTAVLERWLIDAQNKKLLADQKIQQVQNDLLLLNAGSVKSVNDTYNKIYLMMLEANQYLREALNYYHELKEIIKYGNY